MTEKELLAGTIVKHFKRETVTDSGSTEYLYMILGTAQHTETNEELVVYKALYGGGKLYARPKDMFLSEVDREKYPDIKQRCRFEKLI